MGGWTDRRTGTDRKADKQTDRQTDRQPDRGYFVLFLKNEISSDLIK